MFKGNRPITHSDAPLPHTSPRRASRIPASGVNKGKAILAALDKTIALHPCEDHLEVEITGQVGAYCSWRRRRVQ